MESFERLRAADAPGVEVRAGEMYNPGGTDMKNHCFGFVSYFVTLIRSVFFIFHTEAFMPGQEPDGELCGKLQFL